MAEWVISTNLARCRDCYRCVRTCPVKAVRVQHGQAQIVAELCIACASCVRVCPQEAKAVRDDRPAVLQAIAKGRTVVASVAPSAPAYFGMTVFSQIEEALQALGFTAAGETAFGAEMVGQAHRSLLDQAPAHQPVIASACPVVVNLVERYYPDLIPHLAPLVSPMVAHGRWLHRVYGPDSMVVFIGPCIAKKAEALDTAVEGAVDAVLTFSELAEWLHEEAVDVAFDQQPPTQTVPRSHARLFPVEGGLVGTADLETDLLTSHVVTASGIEACEDVLRGIRSGLLSASLVELMACEGGCINGPAMDELGEWGAEGRDHSTYVARQRVIEYATRRQPQSLPTYADWPELQRTYGNRHVAVPTFSDEQIEEVLRRVDKYTPEDELNCGACGYATCREKAVATLRGMAEATMCMPYMRRRAESLRQVVMDVTPNAIVILDTRLYIQDMSPSAERLLDCHLSHVVGRPFQSIVPAIDLFAQVRDTGEPVVNQRVRLRPDLVVEETIVPVEGQSLLVGILRDITERERNRAELDLIRTETVARTQEVIQNQMRVAHEIAQLLGETTAETKVMLDKLARLVEEGKAT
jgi:iron only hydrogenase large subunit-like protein/uncharacterized Fe-S cluster-containing protein